MYPDAYDIQLSKHIISFNREGREHYILMKDVDYIDINYMM